MLWVSLFCSISLLSTVPMVSIIPPVEGHLGCFQFLALTNEVAANICVHSLARCFRFS